jgi:hypothetical protein
VVIESCEGEGRLRLPKCSRARGRFASGYYRRKASYHKETVNVALTCPSETTATTLASALYYLARCPEKQKKLQKLLDEAMPNGYSQWSYEKVKSVSYLDDCINETLRLKPALLTGGPRETPLKGIVVEGTYIPGKVNVVIPTWLIQRDARWWQQPEDFIPERFGERRGEMGTEKAPYLPFSLGTSLPRPAFDEILTRAQAHTVVPARTLPS